MLKERKGEPMETLKTLFVTGYRSSELSVFTEKDPKIQVVKKVIKMQLKAFLEEGLKWIVIGGNLGVEIWAGQVALELKKEYPELQLAIIQAYQGFEEHWNESNQQNLHFLKTQADFVDSVSRKLYHDPSQLKNHTSFMIQHTDGALVIYDEEYPGKTKFFLEEVKKQPTNDPYLVTCVTMDDLQNAIFEDTV